MPLHRKEIMRNAVPLRVATLKRRKRGAPGAAFMPMPHPLFTLFSPATFLRTSLVPEFSAVDF